jgi:hypothetical protein
MTEDQFIGELRNKGHDYACEKCGHFGNQACIKSFADMSTGKNYWTRREPSWNLVRLVPGWEELRVFNRLADASIIILTLDYE